MGELTAKKGQTTELICLYPLPLYSISLIDLSKGLLIGRGSFLLGG